MAKATILDRLAGAMETLGKREGKALTPRQRVAAAQRWNSLADIGENRLNEYRDTFVRDFLARDRRHAVKNGLDNADYGYELWGLMDLGLANKAGYRADNPFLSTNGFKYMEQSDFLDWCRDNGVEPNARTLKQFRWEEYQTLPYRQQQWIANKDAIKSYLGPEMYGYDKQELSRINTLDELEDYLQEAHPEDDWPRDYPMDDSPVFESMDEFPDDFDYMWRY